VAGEVADKLVWTLLDQRAQAADSMNHALRQPDRVGRSSLAARLRHFLQKTSNEERPPPEADHPAEIRINPSRPSR